MYVVLVTDKQLGGTTPLGPYRTREKAQEIADLCRNPYAVEFYGTEEYDVAVALLRKYDG